MWVVGQLDYGKGALAFTPTFSSYGIKNLGFANENINPNLETPSFSFSTHAKQKTQDIYHLHVDVLSKYMPLEKCYKNFDLSQSKESKEERIKSAIWTWQANGLLYPKDPLKNAPLPFRNITSLLQFLGRGQQALLRYTQNLKMSAKIVEQ